MDYTGWESTLSKAVGDSDYIIHIGAISDTMLQDNNKMMKYNYEFSKVLFDLAKIWDKPVIYSSSAANDGDNGLPSNFYGWSKYVTEQYGLNVVDKFYALRYFNVYSEDQTVDGPYATAVANWMHFIRQGQDPFITGNGEQRRDMLYVHDAVSANIFCMNRKEDFKGAHYDVGTGTNISLNEMREIVWKHHPKVIFKYKDARAGDVLYTKANTKPLGELGWKVDMTLSKGLDRCFKGVRNGKA